MNERKCTSCGGSLTPDGAIGHATGCMYYGGAAPPAWVTHGMTPGTETRPNHYGGASDQYEAIKVMLAWHGPVATVWFCRLNAEKYLCRAGKKGEQDGSGDQLISDLKKAAWYANAAAVIMETGKVPK